jgi:hypothetical protein
MIPKLNDNTSAYGSKGTKHNSGKPALSIFPRSAAIEAAKTFMDGAEKYSLHNYKQGLSAHEMADALLRHLYAWLDGETNVPDSKHGAHHLGAVIANAAMIIECERLGTLTDDRFKKEESGREIDWPTST